MGEALLGALGVEQLSELLGRAGAGELFERLGVPLLEPRLELE